MSLDNWKKKGSKPGWYVLMYLFFSLGHIAIKKNGSSILIGDFSPFEKILVRIDYSPGRGENKKHVETTTYTP